jgi:heat shock protein HslJ
MTVRVLVLALIASCATSADFSQVQERDWKLVWVEGFSSMPAGVATPTMRFGSDGRFGGNTGCNSAGADYTAERDRLSISTTVTTKRACLNPLGNQLERAYIGAVERTRRFRMTDGDLELLDEGGTVVARLTSQP